MGTNDVGYPLLWDADGEEMVTEGNVHPTMPFRVLKSPVPKGQPVSWTNRPSSATLGP